MKKTQIPDIDETVRLISKFHVPKHVLKHSIMVNFIAIFLANEIMLKADKKIDRQLVDRASVMHDLFRIVDMVNMDPTKYFEQTITPDDRNMWQFLRLRHMGQHHAVAAHDFFKKDYPKLAETIWNHRFTRVDECKNWESKLVYYADKRVDNYSIVDLPERFRLGEERNRKSIIMKGTRDDEREAIKKKIFRLEKEIFDLIGKKPEFLDKYISEFVNNYDRNLNKEAYVFNDWRKILNIELKI